jgi:hypothetical protein
LGGGAGGSTSTCFVVGTSTTNILRSFAGNGGPGAGGGGAAARMSGSLIFNTALAAAGSGGPGLVVLAWTEGY